MDNPPCIKINAELETQEIDALIDLVKLVGHPNMRVLEIGTGQGGSSIEIYRQVVKDFNGSLYTIDIKPAREILAISEAYPQFHFMIGRSEDFLRIFSPLAGFDLIFIDGSHVYQDVLSDIQLSLPLIREGGILCGHDCEGKYSDWELPEQQFIDYQCQQGQDTPFCHAGVVKALYDVFQDNYELCPSTRIWHVKKITA